MTDTPRRIGPGALGAAASTLFTVPGATTTILRNIHVANTTAAPIAVRVSIGADAAGTRLYSDTAVPANGALDWSGFIPMSATEILQGMGGSTGLTLTAGAVDVT